MGFSSTILIIAAQVPSHLYALVGLAKILTNNNYKVFFTGGLDKKLDSFLLKQGFNVVELKTVPFALSYQDELNYYKQLKKSKRQFLLDRICNLNFQIRKNSLETIVNQTKPSIILLDSFLGADFVCLYQVMKSQAIKFAFINTMIAQRDALIFSTQEKLSFVRKLSNRFNYIFRSLPSIISCLFTNAFILGKSTPKLIKESSEEIGLPRYYQYKNNHPLSSTFFGIHELILTQRELPSKTKRDDFTLFCGFLIEKTRQMFISHSDLKLINNILTAMGTIVYVSFGSLWFNCYKLVRRFLSKLQAVAFANPKLSFVIANIPENIKNKFLNCSPNFHLFGVLPQMLLLKNSKVFITHGGINSLKEAILFKVPFIVYPLNNRYDQPINAKWAYDNKFGLVGNIKKDTAVEICCKINNLVENKLYKQRMERIAENEKNYNDKTLLDLMNQLKSLY